MIEDGKIVCLFDANSTSERNFIAYDGYDVLASTQEPARIHGVLYDLPRLHIGKKAGTDHPDEIDLVTTSSVMEDSEGSFCGWAVLFKPKAMPGKKRKPAESQQQNKQAKRRSHH